MTAENSVEVLIPMTTANKSPSSTDGPFFAISDSPSTPTSNQIKVQLSRAQFALVYLGLLLGILMAALDQTIVSTALKSIVADLGNQELVPWIGSAYFLTAAPFGTMYGKLTDLFGRKWVFVISLVIFEVGSLLCGVTPSMEVLILGRTVAGAGGGGIMSLVFIILSDIVTLQDRGKYQGIMGAVFGLSSVIGPLVGGAFSDHVTWRWCFLINLPLGAITVTTVIIFLQFPALPTTTSFHDNLKRVDFLGTVMLFVATFCVVTPLQLGGSVWAWKSAQSIALFILSPILFGAFVYVEKRVAKEPIVPAELFCNMNVPVILGTCFLLVVSGDNAMQAGIQTIPLIFGVVLLNIGSGVYISKTGPLLMIVGASLTATLDSGSIQTQKTLYLLVLGIGSGSLIQTRVLAIQSSVPRELIAVATAAAQTCQTLGGAFAVSVAGTIFNNVITSDIGDYTTLTLAVEELEAHHISVDLTSVLALSAILNETDFVTNKSIAIQELVDVFNHAYKIAYLSLLVYPVVIFVIAPLVKQINVGAEGKGESRSE
ncbi:hypothetical protein HK100_004212 [Physocladia obscura]|uniref:Major facilitator superfamily (MFS) profile domain-containing protein n=1 Tax=Physocladia obscura TaxID=109957 RepID=A0AAD5X8W7_9FUNG|nr:hypothetical protein HK100_004212 [Physocladia obscura]